MEKGDGLVDGRKTMWNKISEDIEIKIPKSDKWNQKELEELMIKIFK